MTLSILLVLLWVLAALVCAMIPSATGRRKRGLAIIVAGIPILGLVTAQHGPLFGLLGMAGGMVLLRWPLHVLFLGQRSRPGHDA